MPDVVAQILRGEPDWEALPKGTPHALVRLLQRCLERDTRRRLRDLGDLDLALERAAPTSSRAGSTRWVAAGAGIAAVGLVGAFALAQRRELPPVAALPMRFQMPFAERDYSGFTVSPDGRRVAFFGLAADGVPQLWIRSLDTLDSRPISGTEHQVGFNSTMFWSPDSRSLGFYADGAVKRVDSQGGVPQVVRTVQSVLVGGSWSRNDVIVLGNTSGGLLKCPAGGGAATAVTTVADPNTLHVFPSVLPDGRHALYLHVSRADPSENGLFIADLEQQPGDQTTQRLLATGFGGAYVPTDGRYGRIFFARDEALFAVRFDAESRALAGEPVQIAAPVGSFRDGAFLVPERHASSGEAVEPRHAGAATAASCSISRRLGR